MERKQQFDSLVAAVNACHACDGVQFSHVLGPANGPLDARVMFVGEAPGRRGAARTGIPFHGDESGRRFEMFLALGGLRREEVFITNAALCNPLAAPGRNRPPSRVEVARCGCFLRLQIEVVRPQVVVALGSVALTALRRIEGHEISLRSACGAAFEWFGRLLVPLYHVGRRSTLSRPEDAQKQDWLRLRRLLEGQT